MIKLTIRVFKALPPGHLGELEKIVPKNANMDDFSSQLFRLNLFYVEMRNDLSE